MTPPLGTLRAAFEATGSPTWVMRVIREQGFDRDHGFTLDLMQSSDRGSQTAQATQGALAAGEADLIDTDWITIARSHQTGEELVPIFPYGRIMGGMVTAAGSDLKGFSDLPGRRVGLIRSNEKNWIVIRAAFRHRYGSDPHEQAIVKEALSKTTLMEWLKAGEVDAAVLPWQLVPRLITSGRFRKLCDVLDLISDLGAALVPTTFFVVPPAFASTRQELISAFRAAYIDAVDLMRADEMVWREAVAAPDDSPDMLAALRLSWLRRICYEWGPEGSAHLERLFERLKSIAGEKALGVDHIPRGLFGPAFI
jgi:NitT/TauT family transport system substrate-binding protein